MANETNGTSEVNAEVSGEEQILQLASLLAAILGIEEAATNPANAFANSLKLVAVACSNTGNITKYCEELKKLQTTLGGTSTNVKNPALANLFGSNTNVSNAFSGLSTRLTSSIDIGNIISQYGQTHSPKMTAIYKNALEANYEVEGLNDLQNTAKRLSRENKKQDYLKPQAISQLESDINYFNLKNKGREFDYKTLNADALTKSLGASKGSISFDTITRDNFELVKEAFRLYSKEIRAEILKEKESVKQNKDDKKAASLNYKIKNYNIDNPSAPFIIPTGGINAANYKGIGLDFSVHKEKYRRENESFNSSTKEQVLENSITKFINTVEKFNLQNPERTYSYDGLNKSNFAVFKSDFAAYKAEVNKDSLKGTLDNQKIIDENLILNLKNMIERFNIRNSNNQFFTPDINKENFDVVRSEFSTHQSRTATINEAQKNFDNAEILTQKIEQLALQIEKSNLENKSKFEVSRENITPENYRQIFEQFKTYKAEVARDSTEERVSNQKVIDANLVTNLNNLIAKFNLQNPNNQFPLQDINSNNFATIRSQFAAHKSNVAVSDEAQKQETNTAILTEKVNQLIYTIQKFNLDNPFNKFSYNTISNDNYGLVSAQFKTHQDNLKANPNNVPLEDWEVKDLRIKAIRAGIDVDSTEIKTKGDAARIQNEIRNKPYDIIENSYTSIKALAGKNAETYKNTIFDNIDKIENPNIDKNSLRENVSKEIDVILQNYDKVLQGKYVNLLRSNKSPENLANKFQNWENTENFSGLYNLLNKYANTLNLNPITSNPQAGNQSRNAGSPNNERRDIVLIEDEGKETLLSASKRLKEAQNLFNESWKALTEARNNQSKVFNNIVSDNATQQLNGFNVNSNIVDLKDFINKLSNSSSSIENNTETKPLLQQLSHLIQRSGTLLSHINNPEKLQEIVNNSSDAYKLRELFKSFNDVDIKSIKESSISLTEAFQLVKNNIQPLIDQIRKVSGDNGFMANNGFLENFNSNNIATLSSTLNSIALRVPETEQALRRAESTNDKYRRTLNDAQRSVDRFEESAHKLGRTIENTVLNSLTNLERRFSYNNGFSRVFSVLGQFAFQNTKMGKLGEIRKDVPNPEKPGEMMSVIARQGFNLGTIAGGGLGILVSKALSPFFNEIKSFFKNSLANFGDIQSLKTNLGVVYGSQADADNVYKDLSAYALKSPFGIEKVTEFAVLLKQSGVYSTDLLRTLKMIGDVAGGNQSKFQRIANNYAQIVANGKATSLDMRQFANAGLPIYKEIEKITGRTTAEIRKMTSKGKLTSSVIEQAFTNMTQEGGAFYKGVEKSSKNYKTQVINLGDVKKLNSSEFGEYLYNWNAPWSFYAGKNNGAGQDILNILTNIHESLGNFFSRYNTTQKQIQSANFFEQYTSMLNSLSSIQERRKTDSDPMLAILEDELKENLKKFLGSHSFTDEMAKASAKVKNTVIESKSTNEILNSAETDLMTISDLLTNNKLNNQKYLEIVYFDSERITTEAIPNEYKKIVDNPNYSSTNVENQSQVNDIFKIGKEFSTDEKKNIYKYRELLETLSTINTIIAQNSKLKEMISDWGYADAGVASGRLNKVFEYIQFEKQGNINKLSEALNSNEGYLYKNIDTSSKVSLNAENTQKSQRADEHSAYSLNDFMRQQYDASDAAKTAEEERLKARKQEAKKLYDIQQKYGVKENGLDWANKNGAFFNKKTKKYDIDKFYELYNLFSSGTAIEINDPLALTDADVKEIESNFNNLYNFIIQSSELITDIELRKDTLTELTNIRNNLYKYKTATTEKEKNNIKNNFANAYSNLLNTDEKNSLGYRLQNVDDGRLADLIIKSRIRTTNDLTKKEWIDADNSKKKNTANFRPLWERLSTQTLGIPAQILSSLNNKGGSLGYENGKKITDKNQFIGSYFKSMNTRSENTSIAKAMLASGVSPIALASMIKQQKNKNGTDKYVGIEGFNRTKAVNQNTTNTTLRSFALDEKSSKSVTDAMLTSIGESINKIDTFFASAAFQIEDASMGVEDYAAQLDKKTYDSALQAWNQLGYGYNELGKLKDDVNAFSLSLKEGKDGAKTFEEFLPNYLDGYRKNLKALQESTATLSAFKSVFDSFLGESFKEKQEQYNLSASARGSYITGNEDFDSAEFDIQKEIITKLQEALNSQSSLKAVADVLTSGQGFSVQMIENLIGQYGTDLSTYSNNADKIAEKLAKENGVTDADIAASKTVADNQLTELSKQTTLLAGIYKSLGGDSNDLLEKNNAKKDSSNNTDKKSYATNTNKEETQDILRPSIPSFKDMSLKEFISYFLKTGIKNDNITHVGQDALKQRGFKEADIKQIANILIEVFDAKKSYESAKNDKSALFEKRIKTLKTQADTYYKIGESKKGKELYDKLIMLYTPKDPLQKYDYAESQYFSNADDEAKKVYDKYLIASDFYKKTSASNYLERSLGKIFSKLENKEQNKSEFTQPVLLQQQKTGQSVPTPAPAVEQVKNKPVKTYADVLDEVIDIWREEQKTGNITNNGYNKYISSSFNAVDLKNRLFQNPDISPDTIKNGLNFGGKTDLNWMSGANPSSTNYLEQQGRIYIEAKNVSVDTEHTEVDTPKEESPDIEQPKVTKDLLDAAKALKNDKTFTAFKKYSINNGYNNPYGANTSDGINTNGGVKIEGTLATDTKSDSRFNWKDFSNFFDGANFFNIFGNRTRKVDGSSIDRHGYYDKETDSITWNTAKEERALTYLRENYEGFDSIKTSKDLSKFINGTLDTGNEAGKALYEKTTDGKSGIDKLSELRKKLDNKETLSDEEKQTYNDLSALDETLQQTNSFLAMLQNMGVDSQGLPFFNKESQSYQVINEEGELEDVDTSSGTGTTGSILTKGITGKLSLEESNKFAEEQLKGLEDRFSGNIFSGMTSGLSDSLEMWGQMTKQGKSLGDIIDSFKDKWKEVGASMMKTIGADMTSTGLKIAGAQAMEGNWGGVAAGLALAASGGIMSFTSGILSGSSDDDDDDGSEQKIQSLKDALSELIDQAKTDAEYYQKNLLHKNALASNEAVSTRSVNDAIITPNGSVVTTHPDDYLIATKTPGSLINAGNKGGNYSPNITFSVINASGQNVEISDTEESVDEYGNVDIRATIVAVAGEAIASGELDDAFSAMQYRQQGSPSVAG